MSLRSVVPALLLVVAALLLTSPDAHAGSYVGTSTVLGTDGKPVLNNGNTIPTQYSGGIYTIPGPGNKPLSPSPPYAPGATQNLASGYGGDSGGITASCTGPISVSWKWVPDTGKDMTTDPPPSQVIVAESCSVEVTVVSPAATGSYDTGMGKSGTVTWVQGGNNNSVSATSVRYKALDGGASVTLKSPVSPSAVASAPGDAASVRYTATISPIFVTLSGCNSSNQALTGQQITATLSGAVGKITSYTWTQPSATCFKTYNENAASNQLVALSSADLSGPAAGSTTVTPLAFYDRAQENLTVNCAVSFTAPDGTALSATAKSPSISVLKPTVTWDIYTGYVQHVQNPSGQRGYQLMPAPGSTHAGGEAWSNAKIVVPAPFTATGGSGCFAQLITPDTEITNDDPAKAPTFLNNKQQGLDNSFPYKVYKWDVSGPGANFDGPGLFYENYNSSGYAGWSKASETDAFTTWVMYQPPGGVWVPLQSYDWNWSFTSLWSNSQDQWTLFRARPATVSDDPHYQGSVTDNPPQWKLVQSNS